MSITVSAPVEVKRQLAVLKEWDPFLLKQLEELWPHSLNRREIEIKTQAYQLSAEERRLLQLYHLYYTPFWYEDMSRFFIDTKERDLILPYLYAYATDERRIYFQKWLGHNSNQYIFLGRMIDKEKNDLGLFVIKWVNPTLGTGTIEDETKRWIALQHAGANLPLFSVRFSFWGQPVLVMEYLAPLSSTDNEYMIGLSVLRFLRILFTSNLGVHNDIKPHNIMKSRQMDDTKSIQYYLIDFGSMADRKKNYGFERQVWSYPYASQVEEYGQVTTPKYDLLELISTIKGLRLITHPQEEKLSSNDKSYLLALHDYVRNIAYSDKLYPLIELIRLYPDNAIPSNLYDKLEEALQHLASIGGTP